MSSWKTHCHQPVPGRNRQEVRTLKNEVLILVGPTASGKTGLSMEIAEISDAEIVCADSRQIFRFMDIGTAKPTVEERARVPHHCIDLCMPDQYFSAGEYAKTARTCISELLSRKRLPVVVGGSGLYIQALVDGVFQGNFRDAAVRQVIREEARERGWDTLHRELMLEDPVTAGMIHENDQKRIIRALEVLRLTGRPISQIREEETVGCDFKPVFVGLRWPREILYKRIGERADQMIRDGLIAEVRQLLAMGYPGTLNSMNSVGYKEIVDYLSGASSLDEAVLRIKQNTRNLAKKQMTWFRRDERIHWMELGDAGQLAESVQRSLLLLTS